MNIIIIIPIALGWLAALLVNYLADVLPVTRKLTRPTCQHCAAKSAWTDYLLLKGCAACGKTRSWRTWLVQLLSVAASLYVWFAPPKKLGYWLGFILLIYLAVVFVIDVEHRLVLHPVSIFGAFLSLGIGYLYRGILRTMIGGGVGFGIMFLLYYLGVLFARWSSRKRGVKIEEGDALGFGDVILAGVLGLLLGYPVIISGILMAILVAGAFSILMVAGMLIFKRYESLTAIPYAPFLILGALILLYG